MTVKLIVGLGNPGTPYAQTRHNAGFWFLNEIAKRQNLTFCKDTKTQGLLAQLNHHGEVIYLLKPSTFMNRSGDAVSSVVQYWKIKPEQILIAHDELDFQPGVVKLKSGGGHGGHNGLRDIFQKLGSKEFYRLRIGIGHPGDKRHVADYVLDKPSILDAQSIHAAIERSVDHLQDMIDGKLDAVMNALHA